MDDDAPVRAELARQHDETRVTIYRGVTLIALVPLVVAGAVIAAIGCCAPLCPPGAPCDAAAPRCGDGACNSDIEGCRLCPGDCGACTAVCGDNFCDPGETAASCKGDCS